MKSKSRKELKKVMHITREIIKVELIKKHSILFVSYGHNNDFVTSISSIGSAKNFIIYCLDKGINSGFIIIQCEQNDEEHFNRISKKIKKVLKYCNYIGIKVIDFFSLNEDGYKSIKKMFV